jgi:ribosomal protein L37AE/L43A
MKNPMKSSTYEYLVGLVGLLEGERPRSFEPPHNAPELVEPRKKPDHKADHKADQAAQLRPGNAPDPELAAAIAAIKRAFPGARPVEVRHGDRPAEACRWCRGRKFWRKSGGPWVCERCHPPVDTPAERTTLPGVEGAELSQSKVVEATFRPTVELVYPQPGPAIRPTKPEFPRCPECDVARYWIAPTGKVICGSCGKVRLIITAIEYHSVQ